MPLPPLLRSAQLGLPPHYPKFAMVDIFSKRQRSDIMSRIRSRGNRSTELEFARLLRAARITGWRRHQRLPGNPDFVFIKHRLAVFVDGCFWHGCKRCCHTPSSNRNFWEPKILRNRQRDRFVGRTLRKTGWKVLRIWEHELKKPDRCLARTLRSLLLARPELRQARSRQPQPVLSA